MSLAQAAIQTTLRQGPPSAVMSFSLSGTRIRESAWSRGRRSRATIHVNIAIPRRLVDTPTTMKQRITYVVTDPESFNPEQINVKKEASGNAAIFELNGVKAAKEHRITLGLDELSQSPIDM